jgi:hypothetical protein
MSSPLWFESETAWMDSRPPTGLSFLLEEKRHRTSGNELEALPQKFFACLA